MGKASFIGFRIGVLLVLALVVGGCDTSRNDSLRKMSEAVAQAARGEHVRATKLLEEALAIDPTNSRAHTILGTLRLQELGDPGGAVASLERAVELSPEDSEARYQLAVALLGLGRSDRARTELEAAIARAPTHANALYRLGALRESTGDVRGAIDDYTRSIFANPRQPHAYNALGSLYLFYGRPQEAIQVLGNALENNPEDASLHAELGRAYLATQDEETALVYLKKAAVLKPGSLQANYNLAEAYRSRWQRAAAAGDRDEAIAHFKRARVQCNPARDGARCDSIEAALRELEGRTSRGR